MMILIALLSCAAVIAGAQVINLPSSKQITGSVQGAPQRLNSLPMTMAWSPDHRLLAIVNAGFGTAESSYHQSIAILDTATGRLTDSPDPRTGIPASQTLYSGLAFSSDGRHLYASIDSLSAPEAGSAEQTGNAIAVYTVSSAGLLPERLIPIPLQKLAAGRTQNQFVTPIGVGLAVPVPAGMCVLHGTANHAPAGNGSPERGDSDQLLVADEFSDDVLLLDTGSGRILQRFDLADANFVPSTYPIAIVADKMQRRAYVALWNGSAVAQLDLRSGRVLSTLALMPPAKATDPSSHPVAMAIDAQASRLYVALANRDAVAVVSLGSGDTEHRRMRLAGTYDTRLPGQTYFGAMPDALALSADGRELYVANSGSDAVAVFHTAAPLKSKIAAHPAGFIPTEWYPTALAVRKKMLYVATAKSKGTGPNSAPQPPAADPSLLGSRRLERRPHTYIGTLLHGSLASIDLTSAERELPRLSRAALASNLMVAAQQHLRFGPGANPIRHVIYIIKENRTYDQIFGDLGAGDGDPSLTMYGRSTTPNQHKLAEQFGILDNFYDSGEVSGDGHVWSTAAITSDFTERDWQQSYRGKERNYDFEGLVEQGYPIEEGIPDINEPSSGYLWTDLARHGKSLYHFGEFISTEFCDDSGTAPKRNSRAPASPALGTPEPAPVACPTPAVEPGAAIPANYGGGVSNYRWSIPLIHHNLATKPELRGHFDPLYPDFNLKFPDQLRVEEFLTHLRAWQQDREGGLDTMPDFIMLRLPNDHTAGTTPGSPTPRASVADNDLAVGRAVEAISHSAYWGDTAFFIAEDDAQDGADHVDAHRSIALVVSKYSERADRPVVDHTFYTTVSMLRTIEDLLGIPPMNNNDAFAPLIQNFSGKGQQPPFAADYSNRDNQLIYQVNTAGAPGAAESKRMDFSHEDRADPRKLNVILWRDAMGDKPIPWMVLHPHTDPNREDADD
ncbi:MAG TPA: phosphoesterase [Acidisarcina sp.]